MADKPEKPYGPLARLRLLTAAALDPRLAKSAVTSLAVVLDHLHSERGDAWPSLNTITRVSGLARSTVVESMATLKTLGYLVKQRNAHRTSNVYRLGVPTSPAERPSPVERTPPERTTPTPMERPPIDRPTGPGVDRPAGPEPSNSNQAKEPDEVNPSSNGGFAAFWLAYPRKVAKPAAEKAWRAKKLDREADSILADVRARMACGGRDGWKVKAIAEPHFIPYPASYLNARRWEDGWTPEPARLGVGVLPRDDRDENEMDAANLAAMQKLGGGRG